MDDEYWSKVGSGCTTSVRGILDMDAFELQIYLRLLYPPKEARDIYLNRPCILVHPTTPRIISVNYVAKNVYQISRDKDSEKVALRKCPNLLVVRKSSVQIPTGSSQNSPMIEKAEMKELIRSSDAVLDAIINWRKMGGLRVILSNASNDETFFDLAEEVDKRTRENSGLLVNVDTIGPNTHMEGKTKFKGPAIAYRYNIVHANMDQYSEERRLIVGAIILEEFRTYVFKETGLEASGGVAVNNLVAKLACSLHKPGGMTIVLPNGFPRISKRILIEKVPTWGGQLGKTLKECFGEYMFDVAQVPVIIMSTKTGLGYETCKRISNMAHGICFEEIREKLMNETLTVGMSNLRAVTLWYSNLDMLRYMLREFFVELCERLQREEKRHRRKADSLRVEFQLNPKGHRGQASPKRGFTLNQPEFVKLLASPTKVRYQDMEWALDLVFENYSATVLQEFRAATISKISLHVPSFSPICPTEPQTIAHAF